MNNSCVGIVLRQQDFKENDVILSVFSKEYGKISLIAKGIKKAKSKNASNCSLFCHSKFYFNLNETSTIQVLKTAEKITLFRHIYEDLYKQAIAQVMLEIVEKIGNEENEYLYELLLQSLINLDATNNSYVVLGLFIAKFNEVVGVNPNVDGCVHCDSTNNIASISIVDGGFICSNCFDINKHQKITLPQLKCFRLFHKAEISDFKVLETMDICTYKEIEPILNMFLEYSGVSLKSISFLQKIVLF